MGSAISHNKSQQLPFTDNNITYHLEQVKKLHTKTSKVRRRVLQNLNSSESMIDIAKEALILAEQTRTYFEQLIAHYPSRPEVWELYASFQELTHNELAADQCHKKVATLRHTASQLARSRIASMTAQVSPRADIANVFAKSQRSLDREQELRDNAPHEFLCPITLEIMNSPVIAPDGFTYEETAIKEWLAKNNRSPLTNLQINTKVLKRNYALHAAITTYLEGN